MKRIPSHSLGVAVFAAVLFTAAGVRAAAPAGRYTIEPSGTVYDTKTNLTWQQVVSSSIFTQAGAAAYCSALDLGGTRWRLPTMKELVTLVDYSVAPPGPTIDPSAFANTPVQSFWTATPYYYSGYAWYVDFSDGETDTNAVSVANAVRCVH